MVWRKRLFSALNWWSRIRVGSSVIIQRSRRLLWEIHKDKGRSIVLVAVRVSLSFSSLSNWWMRRSVIKGDIRHNQLGALHKWSHHMSPRPRNCNATELQLFFLNWTPPRDTGDADSLPRAYSWRWENNGDDLIMQLVHLLLLPWCISVSNPFLAVESTSSLC